MANRVKGETTLELSDGRALVMLFDMDALIEAESVYGKPLEQVMADLNAGFFGAMRAVIFGGLRARHPELTLKACGELFLTEREALTEGLAVAIERAMPADDPADAAEGKQGKSPPGKSSGASGAKQGSTRTRSGKPRRAASR